MEEEQKMISRENMQMLGLTIQKISCLPKNKQIRNPDSSFHPLGTVEVNEVLDLDPHPNTLEREDFLSHPTRSRNRPRNVKKRPQSIRVRGKESPEKRRSSLKPINSEYQNPIYEARILSYRELIFKLQWTYGLYS